jgi:hypothetical protein
MKVGRPTAALTAAACARGAQWRRRTMTSAGAKLVSHAHMQVGKHRSTLATPSFSPHLHRFDDTLLLQCDSQEEGEPPRPVVCHAVAGWLSLPEPVQGGAMFVDRARATLESGTLSPFEVASSFPCPAHTFQSSVYY